MKSDLLVHGGHRGNLKNLTTLPKMKHEHDVKSQTSNYHESNPSMFRNSVRETTTLSGRLDICMYSIHITHSNSPSLKHEVWGQR